MVVTLLCVSLLLPGQKSLLQIIESKGGLVGKKKEHGIFVDMSEAVTDADLADLCELRDLVFLGLYNTKVSDRGLRLVSNLRGLTELDISGTSITDEGLRHLEALTNLKVLVLFRCSRVTKEGVARLQRALPTCDICN